MINKDIKFYIKILLNFLTFFLCYKKIKLTIIDVEMYFRCLY